MTHTDPKDYLANERTYLAWIRTSIGIMAFGFVVGKFALFIKQLDVFLGEKNFTTHHHTALQSYAGVFGVILVGIGVFISFSAFFKYKRIITEIEHRTYHPANILSLLLAISVFLIGLFLIVYLNNSI